VGWICALPIKLAAAQVVMINKEHLAHNTYSTPLHTGGGLWQIAVAGDALVQLLTEAWRAAPHRSIMQRDPALSVSRRQFPSFTVFQILPHRAQNSLRNLLSP
jgi:hypothetical protein